MDADAWMRAKSLFSGPFAPPPQTPFSAIFPGHLPLFHLAFRLQIPTLHFPFPLSPCYISIFPSSLPFALPLIPSPSHYPPLFPLPHYFRLPFLSFHIPRILSPQYTRLCDINTFIPHYPIGTSLDDASICYCLNNPCLNLSMPDSLIA